MGIIQFGLIFAVYVTINNSVREAARWGSIYVFDSTLGTAAQNPGLNDIARNQGMVDRMYISRGILNIPVRGSASGNFSTATTGSFPLASCPPPGTTGANVEYAWYYGANGTNPDVMICLARPTNPAVAVNDARRGYYLDVEAWYHLQVFIPLLQQFLPDDPAPRGAPWIRLPGRMTVVMN
jgi:hypothetical protein